MKYISFLLLIFFSMSCKESKKQIDLLITSGTVYTCDGDFSTVEALAIHDGKIVDRGSSQEMNQKYEAGQVIDASGQFVYPGFIDAHAHYVNYGLNLEQVDLTGAKSWQEAVDRVSDYAKTHPDGWITGRGWDQNQWENTSFPDNAMLNQLFPDRPVLLGRIDGHAAIANQKALEEAGVKPGVKVAGGTAEEKNGKLTGILIDNAIGMVSSKVPAPSVQTVTNAMLQAQEKCFEQGLTGIHDCGLSYQTVELIDSLQKEARLKMKLYVMLSDERENYEWLFAKGKIKTDRLQVRGFKIFSDGALGSRGACLLEPYSDRPGWTGFLLSSPQHFDSVAAEIFRHGFQMCTHAIGDSGNRTMLNIYAKYLQKENDLRWRIEHAQVVDPSDVPAFGKYNIVPSVQPTHATSDMYWAEKRLGSQRIRHAYAYKDLLKQNGWIPLGTDFPVEDISPFKTFLAAVFRQDADGQPAGGFQMENALSREETLKGMTIWAARSAFEENEKGSLEPGKFADIVILDRDLMKIPGSEVLQTKVMKTIVNGETVFSR